MNQLFFNQSQRFMNEIETLNYVKATATALGLPLDDARALRVAGHLQRTAQMAKLLEDVPMVPEHELAEIYKPADFTAMLVPVPGEDAKP